MLSVEYNVSEEHVASIFMIEKYGKQETSLNQQTSDRRAFK
jgi:hypothetical protein